MNRCGRFRRHRDAFFIVHSFRNAAVTVEEGELVGFGVGKRYLTVDTGSPGNKRSIAASR